MTERKNIMTEFRMDEISIVDNPAQKDAKVVLAKRAEAVQKRLALTTLTAGHSHLIVGIQASSDGLSEVKAGRTSYADGHEHSFVIDDAGNIIIADAEGHSHGLSVLVKADNLNEEQLASLETVPFEASETAEAIGTSGETTMSDQNKNVAETAANEELETLKSDLAKAQRLAELNDAEKAYLKGLGEDAQTEFLTLDAEGRQSEIEKSTEENSVIFKSLNGTEYRKSDDPRLVELAKESDEEKKKRMKLEEKAEKSDLEKRAKELSIPGDESAKANLLKAIDTLPEGERAGALELLKANAERLSKAETTLGTTEAPADDSADPVDGIAKKLRDADPSLTPEQAYSKALSTPEGLAAHNARS